MLKRPNTGITTQNMFQQSLTKNLNRFITMKSLQAEGDGLSKNKAKFIPTLKVKSQQRNIRTKSNERLQTVNAKRNDQQKKIDNQQTFQNWLNDQKLQQIQKKLKEIQNINVSIIQITQDDNIDDSIKDLNDLFKNYGEVNKNNFFEKNILEFTQNDDEEFQYQEQIQYQNYKEKINNKKQKDNKDTDLPFQDKQFQIKRTLISSARLSQPKRCLTPNYRQTNQFQNFMQQKKTENQENKESQFFVKSFRNTIKSISKK